MSTLYGAEFVCGDTGEGGVSLHMPISKIHCVFEAMKTGLPRDDLVVLCCFVLR